jgi:hypothetical protein
LSLTQKGLLPKTGLLRRGVYPEQGRRTPRNDKKCIFVSLRAIRRIARQSQPSLWDFFNKPESENPESLANWIPHRVRNDNQPD